MTERKAAEVFPPSEFLRDELAERGWDVADLAARARASADWAGDVVAGRRPLGPGDALKLGRALGTGPELWINLQSAYDSWLKVTGGRASGEDGR